ncbi:MAG: hypothetical protein AAFO78_05530 [Pseudomonadota bacterium]
MMRINFIDAWVHRSVEQWGVAVGSVLLMLSLLAPTAASAQDFGTDTISIQDFIGTVTVKTLSAQSTEDNIRVEIKQGKTSHAVEVLDEKDRVVVRAAAGVERTVDNCCDARIRRSYNPRAGRTASQGPALDEAYFANYPTLIVTVPMKAKVSFIDARIKLTMEDFDGRLDLDACYVYGETGDVDEAVVGLLDGSRLIMGDVDGGIEIDVSGDGDLKVGTAAIADVDIAGPGDVVFDRVEGMLDISVAGSGVVRANWVEGPMTVRVAGSGGAAIRDGRADRLRAIIDGSGGILFNGLTVNPDLRLYGSSEVRLARVQGRVTHEGSGQLFVDGKLRARQ